MRCALSPHSMRVQADQCYQELADTGSNIRIFAVFEERRFLGLVSEKQAAVFPDRHFSSLVDLRASQPLTEDAPLEQAIGLLQGAREDFLPVLDVKGEFLGVVTSATLFAALSKAEHLLSEERASLIGLLQAELDNSRIAASVFETTSEGIMVTDAQARIIAVNRAFTATTGYSMEDVRDKTPQILGSGHHGPDFYQAMWSALREGSVWSGEILNRRKSGEVYPEWLHINAIRDGSGKITHYVGIFSDISQHKEVQKRLHDLAYYDPLTELPNRQLFYDRLEQAVAKARVDQNGFTLLLLDLDRFKEINDSLGHSFGDRLLAQAAQRLRGVVRASDTVARWGGDEFAVILQEPEEHWKSATMARRIIDVFEPPIRIDGNDTYISAGIGIARFPEDGDSVELLVSNADAAMYRAKEGGRAGYSFYTPQLNRHLAERVHLENALRTRLREGGLALAWQPQFRLADGELIGVEVLARWRHPTMGDIPPSRFISIAEESGLILELGRWVLDEAARNAATLCGRVKPGSLRVAINVSPLQMRQKDLEEEFVAPLKRHGLTPACVELEFTESALMSKDFSAEAGLQELGKQGFEFAVDDFGTGYSNLAYLKRFAIHRLKIDRAFVQDIAESETDRQIVAAIISMGHSLGLKVIAEGVETEAQRAVLLQMGCDDMQGFLLGRPLSFEEFVKLLPEPGSDCLGQ